MSARQKRIRGVRRRRAAEVARSRRRLLAGAGITVGATLAAPAAAQADTFTVNSLADPGDGTCDAVECTLREAVDEAEANFGFDRVLFQSGLSGDINLGIDGEIEFADSVEITGPGAGRVTVNAAPGERIFDIYPQAFPPQVFTKVTIAGLTLSGGDPGGAGGAISAGPVDLTIQDAVISGNTADGPGGGIFGYYTNLNVSSSTIADNDAVYGGGIGALLGTTMTVNNSTISGNYAEDAGGGVLAALGDSLLITNSTISGNTAYDDDGGGLFTAASHTTLSNSTVAGNDGYDGGGVSSESFLGFVPTKLTARSTTIAGNTAYDDGGGIDLDGGPHALLLNSIVATNSAGEDGPNIDNQPPNGAVEAGFTLIDDPTDATIDETTPGSNILGQNPQLGPLAGNGGPTETMALSTTSPALDAGDSFGANHDQRAQTRPVELPGIPNSPAAGADGSDIGAFELQSLGGGGGGGADSGGALGAVASSKLNDCIRKAKKKFFKAKRTIATKTNGIADPQLRQTKVANKMRKAKKKRRVRNKWCRRNFS
jgi:CSLREA domain-containing protein